MIESCPILNLFTVFIYCNALLTTMDRDYRLIIHLRYFYYVKRSKNDQIMVLKRPWNGHVMVTWWSHDLK